MEMNELKVIENKGELTQEIKPNIIIQQAMEAAKELQKIVDSRDKKLIVGGKQYLFFEDWQTLGRFDRTTAKVVETNEINQGNQLIGFYAKAVAIRDGIEISAADAECCFDEKNWEDKPRFQLRSMAQTRACAKALRNCLAFIAVLAKYEPTPAEEMIESQRKQNKTELATLPQINLIKTQIVGSHLFKPDTIKDKSILDLLESGMTKTKASEIISWWKGDSKKFIIGERLKRETIEKKTKPAKKGKLEVKDDKAPYPVEDDEDYIAPDSMPE